jgi:hypothetical protein
MEGFVAGPANIGLPTRAASRAYGQGRLWRYLPSPARAGFDGEKAPKTFLPVRAPEWEGSLSVFGCLPVIGQSGCAAAGVRKASREETAGELAPTLMSIYGEFAAAA